MQVEAQIERGTVLEILPGPPVRARVVLSAGPGCEECGARAMCSPEDVERRSLLALVPAAQGFGPGARIPSPGEQVRVEVSGSRVLAAGMWAYGLPLLGLCCGLVLGWVAFAGHAGRELFATLFAVAGGAVPFAVLWLRSRSRPAEEWFDARVLPGEPFETHPLPLVPSGHRSE